MSTPDRPSEEELRERMMPMILELQKLIQERLKGVRPGDELAAISLTSCDHHSCN